MKFYSTNHKSAHVTFRDAVIAGQAPDGGLYFPEEIPAFPFDILKLPKDQLAYEVMRPYAGGEIPADILEKIAAEAVDFPFPLEKITEQIFTLELFHGPTLAFKDVGARLISRTLGFFNQGESKKVTVLVATSGDTGGAVANGFEDVEGVEVIILYPSGKVSPVQEFQLTTCGANIHALEVLGDFDACQAMVKKAFLDPDLQTKYLLTSANSINVARWLPQQFYYLFALQQWPQDIPPVISVPSGNFGNICAGLLAWKSGLPVKHFIAACNENNAIPQFLSSGEMPDQPTIPTLSNAMDVAKPSNFIRIVELFDHNIPALKKMLSADSINDATTRQTISRIYRDHRYTLDPHGAVGFAALENYLHNDHSAKGFFLETAHPVKFPGVVAEMTGKDPDIPGRLKPILSKEKRSTVLEASFDQLKDHLMERRD